MSISNLFQLASRKVLAVANIMISNGLNFCCHVIDDISISDSDDNIIYPTKEEIIGWYDILFTKEYRLKIIPPKALENMVKNGISIKKQPAEIMNFIISTSENRVFVGILLQENCEHKASELVKSLAFPEPIELIDNKTYMIVSYLAESPLKEKDNCQRIIFNHLKKIGVYKLDEDNLEEELYFFD